MGSSGTGKSHLINTVLEATTCEEDYKRNAQNEVIFEDKTKLKTITLGDDGDDGDLQVLQNWS